MRSRFWWIVPGALVPVGAAAVFLLTTVLMDRMTDLALVGVPLMVAAGVVVAIHGVRPARDLISSNRPAVIRAAVGGVLAFWAAPLVVLLQRATDAPSGTETLFFTTAAWAAIVVMAGIGIGRDRARTQSLAVAGALAATAGAASLLANWERPSSFSPFVKFPEQEIVMLLAGLAFAIGTLLVRSAIARSSSRAAVPVAVGSAALVGVATALIDLPSSAALSASLAILAILGLMQGAFAWAWLQLVDGAGAVRAAGPLFLAPVAVTALAALERATSVYGANPIGWVPATAAIVLVVAGTLTVVLPPVGERVRLEGALRSTALALAALGFAGSLVALALPALSATSRGILQGEVFRVDWTMVGAESAVGWVALSAGTLALAAAWNAAPRAQVAAAAIASMIAVAATFALARTPFYTVTRWIPAEVQQAYGTEYARFSVESVFEPVRSASLVLAVAGSLITLFVIARDRHRYADVTEEVAR